MSSYYLTDGDRSKIAESVLRTMSDRHNKPGYTNDGLGYDFPTMSPEVYICKGPVPKRECKKCQPDEPGGKRYIPGKATLPIWKLEYDEGCGWYLEPVTTPDDEQKVIEVFNVRACEIVDDFNICKRDKFGRWHVEWHPCEIDCSSTSSSASESSAAPSVSSSQSSSASSSSSPSSSSGSASSSGSEVSEAPSLSPSASGVSASQSTSDVTSESIGSVPNDCIDVVTGVTFDPVACEITVTTTTICCVCT